MTQIANPQRIKRITEERARRAFPHNTCWPHNAEYAVANWVSEGGVDLLYKTYEQTIWACVSALTAEELKLRWKRRIEFYKNEAKTNPDQAWIVPWVRGLN